MSSHSRSSSEIVSLQYSDVLPVFGKSFYDDFDFDDVRESVKDLFTNDEYQSIINAPGSKCQWIVLLSILSANESLCVQFLERIKPAYKNLSDGIKMERDSPHKKTQIYVDLVHMSRSSHPKHTDFNVLRLKYFMLLRSSLRELQRCHSIVLQGDLGIGKKWLAQSVCYDYHVAKSMDFKIYWLNVRDCISQEQDLNRLQELRLYLDSTGASHSPTFSNNSYQDCGRVKDNESISNRKLELQQYFRGKFRQPEYRNCLLILKDVQNTKTIETFNLGSKLLVITRNKKVSEYLSSKMNKHLTIDQGLTVNEFYTLFEKYLRQKRIQFPKNAIEVYEYSKSHPALLSIIAQNLRQKKSNWDEWIRNLQNLEFSDNKFTKIVEISLNVLSESLLKLYATLAVFPHTVPIPVKLLAAIWDQKLSDAMNVVQRFHNFSFVSNEIFNTTKNGNRNGGDYDIDDGDSESDGGNKCAYCSVPFIYNTYLKANPRMKAMIDSKQLHKEIIDYYKIEEIFQQRTEIDLCNSQHDAYFFTFIGYHLHHAERDELFPMIYLDFGFLEQKMRAVGLSNTIGDLKLFENEITNFDAQKRHLLSELREFLPKIEEKLSESRDTSLLQYALMASGAVYEEAKVQIQKFPQRVWFTERGNFHKRRQIVNLTDQATALRFLDQDNCLIVLANNNILLLDISLDCTTDPELLQNDEYQSEPLIEVRFFNRKKFVITLDTAGVIKVWSIANEQRRNVVCRRSSKQKVNTFNCKAKHRLHGKNYKQRIQENSKGQHGKIVAFFVEEFTEITSQHYFDAVLYLAFSDGDICVFKWQESRQEFVAEKIPILKTQTKDIRFICKVPNTYYLLLDKIGDIKIFNFRNSSKSRVPFEWPRINANAITYEMCTFFQDHKQFTSVIYVFPNCVYSLTFEHREYTPSPNAIVKILYDNRTNEIKNDVNVNSITCAKITIDRRYLILGTIRGIIVYDILTQSEVLRSNVSEKISCLDVYPLEDKIFKYVIISSAEQRKCLNIFAVRTNESQGITWAHNVTSMGNEFTEEPQLEADVWLWGQKLYDINYRTDGCTQLLAVDSKNRVHQLNITKTKSWSIINPRESNEMITAITIGNDFSFVGYDNGDIFNINHEIFEPNTLKAPILYLQIFDDAHLVASTANETTIRGVNVEIPKIINYKIDTKQAFKILDHYLLLIRYDCLLTILNLNTPNFHIELILREHMQTSTDRLCCCDYQNDYLLLATSTYLVVYKFTRDKTTNKIKPIYIGLPHLYKSDEKKLTISAVALSSDASLIALGTYNAEIDGDPSGDIQIYKMTEDCIKYFYCLQSHRKPVHDLKFSIGSEVLASCSEQLCFWSVPYLLNNPFVFNSPKRRSSRFSSQRSSDVEEVDARVIAPCSRDPCGSNLLSVPTSNGHSNGALNNNFKKLQLDSSVRARTSKAWCDKRGPADKPELLACIKFDGNEAKKLYAKSDFTQFNTIDNDGVYYHLTLLDMETLKLKNAELDQDADKITSDDITTTTTTIPTRYDVFDQNFNETTWRVSDAIEINDNDDVGEDEVCTI